MVINPLYQHKKSNIRKTWLLITIFLLFTIGFGWFLSLWWGSSTILYMAVIFSVLMSVGSYWWSHKLVLMMTRAKPVTKEDAPEFYGIVEELSAASNLPMPRLYVMQEQALNAFAAGRDPKHALVCATQGLLRALTPQELQGVIAHEMSHIGNRDMLVSTVVVVLAGIVVMAADFMFRSMLFGGRRDSHEGRAGSAMAVIGLLFMILAPILARLIQLAVSRKREFLADASSALLTKNPDGLARALEKIAADPTRLSVANNATAHLYFENPFKGDRKQGEGTPWLAKLFMTHPPVEERIKALRGL